MAQLARLPPSPNHLMLEDLSMPSTAFEMRSARQTPCPHHAGATNYAASRCSSGVYTCISQENGHVTRLTKLDYLFSDWSVDSTVSDVLRRQVGK